MLTDNHAAPLIVVAEDNNSHAELIKLYLGDAAEEYRLEIAGSLLEAGKLIERERPALVLTDYRLPDGDGNQIVLMVNDACPVIMMTSYGSEQVAVEAMKIGAHDYIVKSPETLENIPATIKLALLSWSLIEARRQTSAAISNAKKDWERTFDAVPDLISIIDLNNTVIRVNKAMADRCGLPSQEMVGQKCYEVVHSLHGVVCCCPSIGMAQGGLVNAVEIEEKSLDGFFDVTVSPLYDEEGRVTAYVHVMRDISERKRAEEERLKLEAQFQQTRKLESLGVLTGGVAHDFNNILTIIMGHCYVVKENLDSGMTDKVHVEKIEAAATRAADLCRQMLAYAGNSPLQNVRISLWLLIDETVKMLQSAIKKNVTIQLDLKRDVPEIIVDDAQIQQVVINLIINAAEAIGDRNGIIKVALRKVDIQDGSSIEDFMGNAILTGGYACLDISDNGCGMNEDVRKQIFEPFFTTKFTGRGLGMSALLGIVKSHDGALQLSTVSGVGTNIKVYLPLPERAASVETDHFSGLVSSGPLKGTILLVDDEESLRSIGSMILQGMGFLAVTAANGREAVELYKTRGSEIDLVMLDMVMPEMGGVETYHELRAIDATVPILICSGYGAESVSDVISADEKAGFLSKPYKPSELGRMLFECLES